MAFLHRGSVVGANVEELHPTLVEERLQRTRTAGNGSPQPYV
jgi:hypothetical protein